jgi:ribosomal protein L11 methyltransferase
VNPQNAWVEIRIPAGEADPAELAGMLAGIGAAVAPPRPPGEARAAASPAAESRSAAESELRAAAALAAGAEIRGTTIVFWVRAADAVRAIGGTRAALARLAASGVPVRADAVEIGPGLPEAEWRDAWKRHFGITRVSEHLVVVPSWERYAPRAGEVVLDLDPGRAFGTGAHASTRLCLSELDALARGPGPVLAVERFLDCGTGSGILAIAAAKLWPRCDGLAIDIDPAAVEVATENLGRNGVGARVACRGCTADQVEGTFDLVVANIERGPLLRLHDALVDRLAPSGVLMLAGVTADETAEVVEAYAYAGARRLRLLRTREREDDLRWSVAVLEAVRA